MAAAKRALSSHEAAARWFEQNRASFGGDYDTFVEEFKKHFLKTKTAEEYTDILDKKPPKKGFHLRAYLTQYGDVWLRSRNVAVDNDPQASTVDAAGAIRKILNHFSRRHYKIYYYLTNDSELSADDLVQKYGGGAATFSAVWAAFINAADEARVRAKKAKKSKSSKKRDNSESDAESDTESDADESESSDESSDEEGASSSSSDDSDRDRSNRKRKGKGRKKDGKRSKNAERRKEHKKRMSKKSRRAREAVNAASTPTSAPTNAAPITSPAATHSSPAAGSPPVTVEDLRAMKSQMWHELDKISKMFEGVPVRDTSALAAVQFGYDAAGNEGYYIPETAQAAFAALAANDNERLSNPVFTSIVRAADRGAETAIYRIFGRHGWIPMQDVPAGIKKILDNAHQLKAGGAGRPLPPPTFLRAPAPPAAHGRGPALPVAGPSANAATSGPSAGGKKDKRKERDQAVKKQLQAALAVLEANELPSCDACGQSPCTCAAYPNA
eukprot:tig00020911_g15704.t1